MLLTRFVWKASYSFPINYLTSSVVDVNVDYGAIESEREREREREREGKKIMMIIMGRLCLIGKKNIREWLKNIDPTHMFILVFFNINMISLWVFIRI